MRARRLSRSVRPASGAVTAPPSLGVRRLGYGDETTASRRPGSVHTEWRSDPRRARPRPGPRAPCRRWAWPRSRRRRRERVGDENVRRLRPEPAGVGARPDGDQHVDRQLAEPGQRCREHVGGTVKDRPEGEVHRVLVRQRGERAVVPRQPLPRLHLPRGRPQQLAATEVARGIGLQRGRASCPGRRRRGCPRPVRARATADTARRSPPRTTPRPPPKGALVRG